MDWISVSSLILAAGTVIAAGWKICLLRKEVWQFEEKVEQALDDILSGRGIAGDNEEMKDTLWGKCGEKLARVERIWRKKEEAGLLEKSLFRTFLIRRRLPLPISGCMWNFCKKKNCRKRGLNF